MNYALKVLLREPYNYLSSKAGRRFIGFCRTEGSRARNRRKTITLFKRPFVYADNLSFLWQFHDIFFRESYAIPYADEAPIIIDCGANIGLSVLYAKSKHPKAKVIAFEPDDDLFDMLVENTNHLSDIQYVNAAVWTHAEGVGFSKDSSDAGKINPSSPLTVKSVDLNTVLSAHKPIDLLKIDIEGAEYKVIENCRTHLAHVKRLFIEAHCFEGSGQRVSGLLKTLEKCGFRYYIENENTIRTPLKKEWASGTNSMDVQMNIFAIRAQAQST